MDTRLRHFQEQIGRNVQAARLSRGKGLNELAGIMKTHGGTLSKIEAGKLCPSIKMLIMIADTLNVPLFQLTMSEEDAKAIQTLTRSLPPAKKPPVAYLKNLGQK